MHALIIEDEGLIALAIEDVLRECGFTSFDFAPSPDEAIEAASRQAPTLITADVQLSTGCGIATVHQICDKLPVPVVFITGNASEVIDRVPDAPVLVKPFTESQLKAVITALI
jgi:DNA-binding response OmpR family regulator